MGMGQETKSRNQHAELGSRNNTVKTNNVMHKTVDNKSTKHFRPGTRTAVQLPNTPTLGLC